MVVNYITTNLINGKQYVGMHSTNDIENDNYLGSGRLITKAIKKYGLENFKREIICICENEKIAHENEKSLIIEYNTLSPNGYNLSPSGGVGNGGFHSDESKKKMSENRKGTPAWNKGIPHTKEAIEKMLVAKSKYRGKPGHKHTEEFKACVGRRNSERIVTDEYREKEGN